MTETDASRIDRLGLNSTMRALEDLWNTPTIYLIQDDRTADLARNGYGPLDAFDAIWHELLAGDAHRYMQHGFTPHQAHLLDTNRQAQTNLLWNGGSDLNQVQEVLASPLPSGLLTRILLVAVTPAEARALIEGCSGTKAGPDGTEDPAAVIASIDMLAGLLTEQVDECDCNPYGNNPGT